MGGAHSSYWVETMPTVDSSALQQEKELIDMRKKALQQEKNLAIQKRIDNMRDKIDEL